MVTATGVLRRRPGDSQQVQLVELLQHIAVLAVRVRADSSLELREGGEPDANNPCSKKSSQPVSA